MKKFRTNSIISISPRTEVDETVVEEKTIPSENGTYTNQLSYRFIYPDFLCVEVVDRKDRELALSNIEARILEKLASNIGKTVDASELMIAVWGRDEISNRNSLHGYIHKLRRAFSLDSNISIINQRGFGYMLTIKNQ